MSNLIPITRIYDIYPKYTYSNDVKKFMDEIVDIDRANVFIEADMVDVLDKIKAEIEHVKDNPIFGMVSNDTMLEIILEIIDKYKEEKGEIR